MKELPAQTTDKNRTFVRVKSINANDVLRDVAREFSEYSKEKIRLTNEDKADERTHKAEMTKHKNVLIVALSVLASALFASYLSGQWLIFSHVLAIGLGALVRTNKKVSPIQE